MIIESTENALSINGIKVLTQTQLRYFNNTTVDGYLFKTVSMDIAKEISYWIKKYLKLDTANDINNIKYILSTQTTDKPNTFIAQANPEKDLEQLAIVNADRSIDFSISGFCETDVMIALALWIDSLDENSETTINGIDPLFVFNRHPDSLDKLSNENNPVKYINLKTKEESEIIYSSEFEIKNTPFDDNDVEVKHQVKSIVNGVPVVETMTQYQLENQSKMVPYIAIHTSENKETNTVDNIYDVYIENDYVMTAIMNLMPTCSYIDVNSDIVEPLLIVNEKYKETATYKIGQIIQIHLTKDLNQPNTSNIETMSIKEAIKQLVELADERGLDSLIGISK